jgi:PleD family two-component response regulator
VQVYTTGQVGRICSVSSATACKWFDSGLLKGYRIPGSKDRRIPRDCLIAFMRENGLPLDSLNAMAKLLIVSNDPVMAAHLKQALPSTEFNCVVCGNCFEAAVQAERFSPDCTIVDFAIGAEEASQICRQWQSIKGMAKTILVAILLENDSINFDRSTVTETHRRPLDLSVLVERIRSLVASKQSVVNG